MKKSNPTVRFQLPLYCICERMSLYCINLRYIYQPAASVDEHPALLIMHVFVANTQPKTIS